MLHVTNDAGRTFRVRCVRRGDRYGLHDCLFHDGEEPLVEFTDVTRGGNLLTINKLDSPLRGGAWSPDGFILYGTISSGLFRVSASGGVATAVTKLDEGGSLCYAHCGSPTRRTRSAKRGSERRLSNLCSTLRFTSPSERSSYAFCIHANA